MSPILKAAALAFALLVCASRAGAQLASAAPSPPPIAAATPAPAEVKPAAKSAPALPPEKARPVRVPRFESAPAIDGRLDEAVWRQAAVLKDFYQLSPGDHTAPTAPTEVLVGFDSKRLYFAFRAFDDPSKVRATIARRDNVLGEDNVRVYLDTFNDHRRAYVLAFNPTTPSPQTPASRPSSSPPRR